MQLKSIIRPESSDPNVDRVAAPDPNLASADRSQLDSN